MLKPTLKLAAQLASAYDEIRQQSNNLMTFTEVRTDPLTGVSNRRALDETLESMFAMMHRYEHPFSSCCSTSITSSKSTTNKAICTATGC